MCSMFDNKMKILLIKETEDIILSDPSLIKLSCPIHNSTF